MSNHTTLRRRRELFIKPSDAVCHYILDRHARVVDTVLEYNDLACKNAEGVTILTMDAIVQNDVSTQLRFESPPRSKPQLVIQVVALVVGSPLLLSVNYRRALRSAWHELRERGQPVWSLRVQADEVVSRHERGQSSINNSASPGIASSDSHGR